MEMHYKRELTRSFMYAEAEGGWSDFEKELLSRRQVEGLLPVNITSENEKLVCWYDITGLQALDGVLGTQPMQYRMLIQLLAGLCGALEQTENHLLDAANIRLSPECIYWSYAKENCQFCYYPGKDADAAQEFRKLMEFVLTKVDHRDDMAVKIAYQVYEEVMKDGYSLPAIRETLQFREEEPVPARDDPESEGVFMDIGIRRPEPAEDPAEEKQPVRKQKRKNSRGSLADTVKEELLKKFFPDARKLKQWKKEREKKKETGPVLFEPEEPSGCTGRPTVLLAERRDQVYGIFKYEGNGRLADLKVTEVPYLIGSSPECGGHLESPAVSRHHARVTKEEDIYFIEDMNSSNGTKVGGRLLDYKMKVSLQPNDIVEFADEKFRFI